MKKILSSVLALGLVLALLASCTFVGPDLTADYFFLTLQDGKAYEIESTVIFENPMAEDLFFEMFGTNSKDHPLYQQEDPSQRELIQTLASYFQDFSFAIYDVNMDGDYATATVDLEVVDITYLTSELLSHVISGLFRKGALDIFDPYNYQSEEEFEDYFMQLLWDAVDTLEETEIPRKEITTELNLLFEDGQWNVIVTNSLLNMLVGDAQGSLYSLLPYELWDLFDLWSLFG